MSVLGLILARGGSRRLPGKNLRLFYGQPLINWTISQGMLSEYIDELAVSSDDSEILDVAYQWPTLTVIRRPKELATDECTSYPPMLHALDEISQMGRQYEWLCLLQPTSPLRTPEDIDECIDFALEEEFPAVASFMAGSLVPNGAIYVGRCDWLRDGGSFDGPAVGRYDMPPVRSVDIDTEEDWEEAESYLEGMMV